MKKLILFVAILFAGVSVVKAEGEVIGEGDVKVTLTLQPFQSIEIGGTGDDGSTGHNVNLVYNDAEDYSKGVTTTMIDHLKVVAAGGYSVKVKAKTGVFNGSGTDTYDVSNITLTAKANTASEEEDGSSIGLTKNDQDLISSDGGTGTGVTYNVAYKGAGDNQYVVMLRDNAETIYTTEVTYTIAVQ